MTMTRLRIRRDGVTWCRAPSRVLREPFLRHRGVPAVRFTRVRSSTAYRAAFELGRRTNLGRPFALVDVFVSTECTSLYPHGPQSTGWRLWSRRERRDTGNRRADGLYGSLLLFPDSSGDVEQSFPRSNPSY